MKTRYATSIHKPPKIIAPNTIGQPTSERFDIGNTNMWEGNPDARASQIGGAQRAGVKQWKEGGEEKNEAGELAVWGRRRNQSNCDCDDRHENEHSDQNPSKPKPEQVRDAEGR